MSLFDIRSAEDARNYVYVLLPVITPLIVTLGYADESVVALWAGLVTALVGPVLAAITTRNVSSFRTGFYALLAAVQALVVGYGIATDAQISVWLPLITTLVGGVAGATAARHVKSTASGA
ncbi:holin [Gordonia phage GMA2]|uniref:Putative holin n=1 Tax=Gordonia phage GMA2 TaxID=1647283 RepID=A0A0K0N761_9CAUD|nr:holin [Gordonia phage GMA2]AKJ72577.1 putative holin [Gordonia phage GMA2]